MKIRYEIDVPLAYEADLAVIGGGPSGIAAAIAGARNGSRTVLIERYGFLGGMATAGLVAPFMKSYSVDGSTQVIRGIFDEFVRRMERRGGAIHPSRIRTGTPLTGFLVFGQDHITPFDPEAVKRTADEMMEELGIRVFFHAQFIDVVKDKSRIKEVLIADKSGIRAVRAGQFIDCSGDGDVAFKCGVPFVYGDGNGVCQPGTTMFRVGNVSTEKTRRYVEEHPEDFMFIELASKAREAGDFPINRRRTIIFETIHPGQYIVNGTRMQHFDGTDADQKSRAEVEGRRQVEIALAFMRKYMPGFENAILLDSAAEAGVRESRHICGDYTLATEDIMSGKHFDDCIAVLGYPIDIHDPSGRKDQFIAPEANFYEIPYRCLLPLGMDNLLVSGRAISASAGASAATRVMPPCFALGEAAGTAACLASREGINPRDLSVRKLQETLRAGGAFLG